MTSAVATIDPAATIAAAVRELYDRLVEIVGRGPTDNADLLDELAALTRPIRSRITRARKLAETANVEPAKSTAVTAPAVPTVAPTVTPAAVPARTVPARTTPTAIASSPMHERVSVRLAEPRAAAAAPVPPAAPRRGRHRKHVRHVAYRTAHTTWKVIRGAVAGLTIGAVGALGGRGLVEAGAAPAWIWLWGIVFFAAFVAGLSFWAVSATKRWGAEVAAIDTESVSSVAPTAATEQGEASPTSNRHATDRSCPCEDDPYYGCDGSWCAGS